MAPTPDTTPKAHLFLLIAHGDRDVRRVLAEAFREEGYHIAAAGNAAELRAVLDSVHVDGMVLDVEMPGTEVDDVIDIYRSRTLFPVALVAGDSTASNVRYALPSNSLDVQVEIRIQRGILNYQLRNALNRQYELVPGFRMPGPINFYGLRWEFWN